jgi:hypothetical protein
LSEVQRSAQWLPEAHLVDPPCHAHPGLLLGAQRAPVDGAGAPTTCCTAASAGWPSTPRPDHSTFFRNRDRLLEHAVVEKFFTEVMTLAD